MFTSVTGGFVPCSGAQPADYCAPWTATASTRRGYRLRASILYRNAQAGNEELHAEVRQHRDRLVPFAVINPMYADWEHDLAVCQEEFGWSGRTALPALPSLHLARPRLP